MTDRHKQPDGPVVAVVTDRAAQRAKELGAGEVLETLRAELEHRPRLGRPIRTVTKGGQQVELSGIGVRSSTCCAQRVQTQAGRSGHET